MGRRIIGATVGTTLNPKKVGEILNPVKSVNGAFPDEHGNVIVGVGSELTSPNGTRWALAVADDGTIYAIKSGAEDGGNGENEDVIVFNPFKFIQVSDTHYQYSQDATAVLVANINALSDVDFVTNSGDLTLTNPATDEVKSAELSEYKENLRDQLKVQTYPCYGNHDYCTSKAEVWKEHTGIELLHEMEHKGCVLLFVDSLTTGWLDWLEEKVADHVGKRIFIYEHYPIENDEFTVGLREGETRYTWNDTAMRRILSLLRNNHNIILFTGHTHWEFGVAVNDVFNDNGLMGTIVHTPYLNAYQGWEVNVNEEHTVLKGVSFGADGMTYLGNGYDYMVEQDTTDYGEAVILTEGETVSVGGETEISVYLATAPKYSQVVNIKTNDIIDANVTFLTFTPQNYNIPQTVKITGNSVGTGRLVLHSNSKTTVRKVDVVAGSAVVNWFNKDKPLTALGQYYGSGSSPSYQLSNLISAKTGDRVRSNTLGSQTQYRLKLFDVNFNYIGEAQNNVQSIDYTITEENVAYVSVVYRGATAGQADTIMVTVNQELPSEYVGYNAEPVGYVLTNYADANNPSLIDGYYDSSLNVINADGQNVSNLIPCVCGDVVYSNGKASNAHTYLYDETKTMIERMDTANGAVIENENAAYFAVDYTTSVTNLMIMKNQKVPGFYVADTDIM